jgi:hypothetical protein
LDLDRTYASQQAGAYLRELLLRPGRLRRRWEQYAERSRPGQVNQLAVAEVLARYLWLHPRDSGDSDVLPRQLKDTVQRAVSGKLLSRSTLSLFLEAFDVPAFERDQIWKLWDGSSRIRMLAGAGAMPSALMAEVATVLGPPRHQTVSMHDHVHVGPDGRIARARTLQVVEAILPGLDRIHFIHDTSALTLEVGQGCKDLSEPLRQIREGVFTTDILLARTLDLGETLTLEYWVTYQYPGDIHDDQEREYRRAVMRRVENFDLRLEFHPDKLPAAVWWAVWDGVDGGIVEQEPVSLDSQHSVHRYLRSLEKTVTGFHWEW